MNIYSYLMLYLNEVPVWLYYTLSYEFSLIFDHCQSKNIVPYFSTFLKSEQEKIDIFCSGEHACRW